MPQLPDFDTIAAKVRASAPPGTSEDNLAQMMVEEYNRQKIQPVAPPPPSESLLQKIASIALTPIKAGHSALATLSDYASRPGYVLPAVEKGLIEGKPQTDIEQDIRAGLGGKPFTTHDVTKAAMARWPEFMGPAISAANVSGPITGAVVPIVEFAADIAQNPLSYINPSSISKPISKGVQAGRALLEKVPGVDKAIDDFIRIFRPFHTATLKPSTVKELEAAKGVKIDPEAFRGELRLNKAQSESLGLEREKEVRKILKDIEPPQGLEMFQGMEKLAPYPTQQIETAGQKSKDLLDALRSREIVAKAARSTKESYVPYVYTAEEGKPFVVSKFSPKNRFNLPKKSADIFEAISKGALADAQKAMIIRARVGERSIANAELLDTIATKFGKIISKKSPAPAGWRPIHLEGGMGRMPVASKLRHYAFPEQIAKEMEQMAIITSDENIAEDVFRRGLGVVKGYMTAMNLSFHTRNLMSNAWNMWLGGMTPAKIAVGHGEAALWARGTAKRFAIGRYSADEIQDAMTKYGINKFGHGAFADMAGITEAPAGANVVNPLSSKFFLQTAGRRMGAAVENTSRVALFLDFVKKHPDDPNALKDAALHVYRYLFNYNELTPFMRGLRDYAMPFITWTSKNVPLQMEAAITQPGKLAALGAFKRNVEHEAQDKGTFIPEHLRPQYSQENLAVQMPNLTTTGSNVLYNLDLPPTDLNVLTNPGKAILNLFGPQLKVPFEWWTGVNFLSGAKEIDRRSGQGARVKAPAILIAAMRQFPQLAGLMDARMEESETGMVITVPYGLSVLARQLPFLTKMGKMMQETRPTPQGKIPMGLGVNLSPNVLNMLGGSVSTISPMDIALQAKRNAQMQASGMEDRFGGAAKRNLAQQYLQSHPTLLRKWMEGGK